MVSVLRMVQRIHVNMLKKEVFLKRNVRILLALVGLQMGQYFQISLRRSAIKFRFLGLLSIFFLERGDFLNQIFKKIIFDFSGRMFDSLS